MDRTPENGSGDTTEKKEEEQEGLMGDHQLWPEIEAVTLEELHFARMPPGEGGWELFSSDGEMQMYKRLDERLLVEPLKALHTLDGVTAREMCNYFFAPEFRLEWETTLEQCTVLERISNDALIFHQVHKRVWPTSQRDSVFWSHMRKVTEDDNLGNAHDEEDGVEESWIVCNHSTLHSKAPETKKFVRAHFTATLLCSTVVTRKSPSDQVTRDNIKCRISYCSTINPGGATEWIPGPLIRSVYKREYPRFLKNFSQYVKGRTKNSPIQF